MSTWAQTRAEPAALSDVVSRPLTILAIGYAQSAHVCTRTACFAARGHKVFLLTETAVDQPIPGVTQLVPTLDPRTFSGRLRGRLSWLRRMVSNVYAVHVWRTLAFLKVLVTVRPDIVHVHFAYAYYGWLA